MARMTRTQIMLDERQMSLLAEQAAATGKSKSELIRLAIDQVYDLNADMRRSREALERFHNWAAKCAGQPPRDDVPTSKRDELYDRGRGGRGW
jgi:hypothetical protein